MSVYRAGHDGLEPNQWKVEKVADVGTSEEFVKEMSDMLTIVDATNIYDPQRQEVKEAITSILIDGLMPAFLELREIRAAVNRNIPLMTRWQLHEDFARKLWKSYKDLTEKAARSMGFKVGFLFDNEKKFAMASKSFGQ